MNGNAIETVGLTKRYRGFALDDLTLTLPRGVVMGLIGENGAGKSTAIKAILDVVKRDSGRVALLGVDADDDLTLAKEDIGVVLDNVGFPPSLTAVQVGKIMNDMYKNWSESAFECCLEKFELPKKKKFSAYSRGMKMKLGIAVAMSHDAKLLILDEATNGLDPVVRDEVVEMFSDLTRDENRSVLISSHIVSDLEKICDYIAFLHGGRLLLCEEKDRLLERFRIVHGDENTLSLIPDEAVYGVRRGKYGAEALVDRDKLRELSVGKHDGIPDDTKVSTVGIEDIFIFTVKGKGKGKI